MTKRIADLTYEQAQLQRKKSGVYNQERYWGDPITARVRASAFAKHRRQVDPESVRAKDRDAYRKHIVRRLVDGARLRAKKRGLVFSVTVDDVKAVMPSDNRCPITGDIFEFGVGKVGPRSMSLDRINPNLGYISGNIAIISFLANTMKNDCVDPQIFLRLAEYLRRHGCH